MLATIKLSDLADVATLIYELGAAEATHSHSLHNQSPVGGELRVEVKTSGYHYAVEITTE